MRVAGFSDGMDSSVQVRLADDLVVRVVNLPCLLMLKLFAWLDRKQEKRDASDIHTLLKQYGDAGNEERLYGEAVSLLEAENFDVEIAGARLLGQDVAVVLCEDTKARAKEILESEQQMEELTQHIVLLSGRNDTEHIAQCELLVNKLRQGFLHP